MWVEHVVAAFVTARGCDGTVGNCDGGREAVPVPWMLDADAPSGGRTRRATMGENVAAGVDGEARRACRAQDLARAFDGPALYDA